MQDSTETHAKQSSHGGKHNPYVMLLIGTLASYAAMYLIMYSMADRLDTVYFNLSNAYMTGLMAGSMVPIMLLTMSTMFPNKRTNIGLWIGSTAFLALCWFLLRAEAGVGDRQFMRAMIPHHSAAIQMAKESTITDPRLKRIVDEILSSQEREIAEMNAWRNVGSQRMQICPCVQSGLGANSGETMDTLNPSRLARLSVIAARVFCTLALVALVGAWITQLRGGPSLGMNQQHLYNDAIALALLGIGSVLDAKWHAKGKM